MGRPRSFDEATAVCRAAELFAEHGYEGTSVDDLVRTLGVHRGSLYQAFGSKRALYLRVLREHVAGVSASGDLTLLLRAAVERAPTDPEAAALVASGFDRLRGDTSSDTDTGTDLARLLGQHVLTRATPPPEET